MSTALKDKYSFDELREIVSRLRRPGGCPWDREQTYESLKECLYNEAQEVLDAVDKRDTANLCEELGDVLLQVIFYADMAEEDGLFTLDDVMTGLGRKLVRRHPHVFGEEKAETPEEALALWKKIKAMERSGEMEV